jgi:hypothetical protein
MLRIGIEMREGIREYEDVLDRIRRRRAVTRTGAIVATIPAILIAVHWEHLLLVLTALGIGGGLKILYDAKSKEIDTRPTHTQFPYLYLWLLQDRAKAK